MCVDHLLEVSITIISCYVPKQTIEAYHIHALLNRFAKLACLSVYVLWIGLLDYVVWNDCIDDWVALGTTRYDNIVQRNTV